MADKADKKPVGSEPEGEDYELLPHKDILELKEELRQLKAKPTEKNLQISMVELSTKLDRLIEIFDEAQAQIKAEGGMLGIDEKIAPLQQKMDKILEQHAEIAKGIVGLSDMVNELKESIEKRNSGASPFMEPLEGPPDPGQAFGPPPGAPNRLPPLGPPPSGPLPPPPFRRR